MTLAEGIALALTRELDTIQPKRPQMELLTPSLDALKSYSRASYLIETNEHAAAIPFLQVALQYDEDFAQAWLALAIVYDVIGKSDSSKVAVDQALRRPHRLSEADRLYIQSNLAMERWDLEEALRLRKLFFEADRFNPYGPNDIGMTYLRMGRYEEALQSFQQAAELHPIDSELILDNQIGALLCMGRFDEVEAVASKLHGYPGDLAFMSTNVARADWAAAESLITAYEKEAASSLATQCVASMARSALLAMRGSVREALALMQKIHNTTDDCGPRYFVSPHGIPDVCVEQAQLVWLCRTGSPTCQGTSPNELPIPNLFDEALVALANGDQVLAEEYLASMQQRDAIARKKWNSSIRLLEAYLFARDEDWRSAIVSLEPLLESSADAFERNRIPMRWLLASAYMETGDLALAAGHFERIIEPREFFLRHDLWMLPLHHAFARQKLVILYAKLGRIEEARRHWEHFQEVFTNPDPELLPLVDEARSALAAAGA
jgi:tetratricopeptide (TPR) repeat protein